MPGTATGYFSSSSSSTVFVSSNSSSHTNFLENFLQADQEKRASMIVKLKLIDQRRLVYDTANVSVDAISALMQSSIDALNMRLKVKSYIVPSDAFGFLAFWSLEYHGKVGRENEVSCYVSVLKRNKSFFKDGKIISELGLQFFKSRMCPESIRFHFLSAFLRELLLLNEILIDSEEDGKGMSPRRLSI